MKRSRSRIALGVLLGFSLASRVRERIGGRIRRPGSAGTGRARRAARSRHAVAEGRQTFRFDTFGDEDFWGGTLKLHQAIEGSASAESAPASAPRPRSRSASRSTSMRCRPRARWRLRSGQGRSRRSGDHAGAAQAQRGRRRDRLLPAAADAEVDRHPVRAVPLDRRRLVRAGHRPPARRLGEPRSERRRDRRARARPERRGRPARRRPGDRAHRARRLGPGQVRRRAVPRRQGLPARTARPPPRSSRRRSASPA